MKKLLYIFYVLSIFMFVPNVAHSTHVSGGEIAYQNLGGDTFEITLTLYRDCSGIPMGPNPQSVRVTSSCTSPQILSLPLQNPGGTEVSQICPAQIVNSSCNGGALPGMEEYIYKGVVVLGTHCSDYLFQYGIANRNSSINVVNSNLFTFYIEASLNSVLYPNNSSPEYTAAPIPYVCVNQTVNYNYGVVENDGDSLTYSLVSARWVNPSWSAFNLAYMPGYSPTTPITGITINPSTGELSFTPSAPLGNYIVVAKVTEYNGAGQVVGTVQRDIQFVIMNCSNQIPQNPTSLSNIVVVSGSASQTDSLEITANVGDNFCFDVTFSDTNSSDTIFVQSNVSAALPGATVSYSGTNPVVATVCWTVPAGMNTNNTVTFQASDSACPVSGANSLAIQVVVPQPPSLTGSLTKSDISCNGICDGSAMVIPSGGVGPYSFYWYPNVGNMWCCQGNDSIYNMCAGTYILVVTDLGDPDPSTNTWDTTFTIDDASPIAIIPPTLVNDNCDTTTCTGSINAFAFGGTPPLNYSWNNGAVSSSITGLCAGVYSLTVSDANGCTNQETYHIYEPSSFTITVDSIDSVSCFGFNDGTIYTHVQPLCGISTAACNTPTSIQIGNGIATNTQITYPAPYGNHYWSARHQMLFTVSELQLAGVMPGALSSLAFDVATLGSAVTYENFSIRIGCTSSNDLTGGWETGLVEVFSPKSHNVTLGWNTHNFDVNFNWDGVSNIVVEICFNNGNLIPSGNSLTRYTSTPNQSVRYFFANNDSVCSNNNVVATTNNRPNVRFGNCPSTFTYSWSPTPALGQTGSTATNLTAQPYSLTVLSNNGCQQDITATVNQPSVIVPVVTVVNPISCNGVCDAEVHINSTGGTGNYSYSWSGGLSPDSIQSGLCIGTYYFTVTDANGCSVEDSLLISNPNSISANDTIVSPISCNGICDGAVYISPSGGNGGPYTINWPAGVSVTNDTAIGLCGGVTYSVTITDATNCPNTFNVQLPDPPALSASITLSQPITCNGICTGQLTAVAMGGNMPYNYLWSNGSNTPSISSLCAGNYSVTITDANGCTTSQSFNITQPLALTVSINQNGTILCYGDSNVNISAISSGGTAPYTYAWSNGSTSATLLNIGADTYTVTVTDAVGCVSTATTIVSEPAALNVSNTITSPILCNGTCSGSITISATGGTPGYTYSWQGGFSGPTQNNLCAGTYGVTVSDANSCTQITSVTLINPPALTLTDSVISNVSCFGNCDGEAAVQVNGGIMPYTYAWPGGQSGAQQNALCAGTYVVTVTDANACSGTITISITQPNLLSVSLSQNGAILCAGDSTVNLTSTIIGGTTPYSYQWSNGVINTPNLANVGSGTYHLTVTDNNQCHSVATIVVTQPDTLNVTINIDTPITCTNTTGQVSVSGTGGISPYTFVWSNGATGSVLSNLAPGAYTVTVTDANGCTDSATVVLNSPSTITPNPVVFDSISCFATCDGAVTYFPAGGAAPYTVTWPSGLTVTNDTATGLCANTTYMITIADAAGCQIVDPLVLSQPDSISLSVLVSNTILCNSECNGELTATVAGGTPTFSFSWSTGAISTTVDSLCAGSYTVTATDQNGCTQTENIVLTQPAQIATTINSIGSNLCFGDTSVTLNAVSTGGTGAYTYLWSTNDTNSSISGLGAGLYFLTTTDTNGCMVVDSFEVTHPTQLAIDSTQFIQPGCGLSNGSITVFVSGGTGSYSYSWNGGSVSGNPISNISSGVYNLLVSDMNGCTVDQVLVLSDSGAPQLTLNTTTVNCAGECNATALVTVSGSGNYSFLWSNNDTSNIADSLCEGSVSVTVTDTTGCFAYGTATIQQDTLLSVSITSNNNILCNGYCTGAAIVSVTGPHTLLSYLWNNGSTTDTLSGLCGGLYTVTVSDTAGCHAIDSVSISDLPPLALVIDSIKNTTCDAASNGSVFITASGGTPTYSYSWTGPNGFTASIPDIINLTSGSYHIQVVDSMGCIVNDTAIVNTSDTFSVSLSNVSLCRSLPNVTLTPVVLGGNGTENFLWVNTSGDTLGNTPTITIDMPSDTMIVSVAVLAGGCLAADSAYIQPIPSPDVEAGKNRTIIREETVSLGGSPTTSWGGSTYLWTPNYRLNSNTEANPKASPLQTTVYTVVVTNVLGCSNTDSIRIKVVDKIVLFSGFSPNGDGDNDVWELPMLADFPNVSVDIYSRWGELIFHSDGYKDPWDGTFNGESLPVGTYYYVIDLKDGLYPKPLNGPVTIMR